MKPIEPRHQLAALIAACQPGKHFLGLWVVRQLQHRRRRVFWTVTYWDLKNEYMETNWCRDPLNAVKACAKALKVIA